MKTQLKTLVFVLILIMGLQAQGADGIAVTLQGNYQVQIAYTNAIAGAEIYMEDADGVRLFKEQADVVKSSSRTLSLEELPLGTYYLVYEDEFARSYTTIIEKVDGLDLVSDESKTVFKPSYKVEGDLVLIAFTNPKEVKAVIEVYDADAHLLGSLSSKKLIVKEALNLKELPAGTYQIGISIGPDYFSKSISID